MLSCYHHPLDRLPVVHRGGRPFARGAAARSKVTAAKRVLAAAKKKLTEAEKRDAKRKVKLVQ